MIRAKGYHWARNADRLDAERCVWLYAVALVWSSVSTAAEPPNFERAILPIVQKHCYKCHGAGAIKGGLDLRTLATVFRGGDSGEPAVVPGKSQASPLFAMIDSGKMPPK